jgi:hypothetical protein
MPGQTARAEVGRIGKACAILGSSHCEEFWLSGLRSRWMSASRVQRFSYSDQGLVRPIPSDKASADRTVARAVASPPCNEGECLRSGAGERIGLTARRPPHHPIAHGLAARNRSTLSGNGSRSEMHPAGPNVAARQRQWVLCGDPRHQRAHRGSQALCGESISARLFQHEGWKPHGRCAIGCCEIGHPSAVIGDARDMMPRRPRVDAGRDDLATIQSRKNPARSPRRIAMWQGC